MTTYLTKITTSPDLTRDIHRTHQILTTAVCSPDNDGPGRTATRLLHRVERGGRELLVQSSVQPDPARLHSGCAIVGVRALDPLLESLTEGRLVRYKITANPTHAPNRNRVPITDPNRVHLWWHKLAGRSGLDLAAAELVELKRTSGMRRGRRVTIHTATLTGTANVTDADTLREAIRNGIGHARAYGCGLLSVAPLG